jgi:hypothetical protein
MASVSLDEDLAIMSDFMNNSSVFTSVTDRLMRDVFKKWNIFHRGEVSQLFEDSTMKMEQQRFFRDAETLFDRIGFVVIYYVEDIVGWVRNVLPLIRSKGLAHNRSRRLFKRRRRNANESDTVHVDNTVDYLPYGVATLNMGTFSKTQNPEDIEPRISFEPHNQLPGYRFHVIRGDVKFAPMDTRGIQTAGSMTRRELQQSMDSKSGLDYEHIPVIQSRMWDLIRQHQKINNYEKYEYEQSLESAYPPIVVTKDPVKAPDIDGINPEQLAQRGARVGREISIDPRGGGGRIPGKSTFDFRSATSKKLETGPTQPVSYVGNLYSGNNSRNAHGRLIVLGENHKASGVPRCTFGVNLLEKQEKLTRDIHDFVGIPYESYSQRGRGNGGKSTNLALETNKKKINAAVVSVQHNIQHIFSCVYDLVFRVLDVPFMEEVKNARMALIAKLDNAAIRLKDSSVTEQETDSIAREIWKMDNAYSETVRRNSAGDTMGSEDSLMNVMFAVDSDTEYKEVELAMISVERGLLTEEEGRLITLQYFGSILGLEYTQKRIDALANAKKATLRRPIQKKSADTDGRTSTVTDSPRPDKSEGKEEEEDEEGETKAEAKESQTKTNIKETGKRGGSRKDRGRGKTKR